MSDLPLRVDYHMHTCYSYDSDAELGAIIDRAREARIDRLCVTDHDTIEGALRLQEMAGDALEVVIGCEFSTQDGSQVVGLGLPSMIHEQRLPDLVGAIRDAGGKVLLPHPFRRGSGVFRPEARRSEQFIREVLAQTDLVECFNGRDSYDNNVASYAFVRDRGLPAVASSDAHAADEIGSVFVEYEEPDAVDGMSMRRIYFPQQVQRHEHPVKRVLMERYHRYQDRAPGIVRTLYRRSRSRYHAARTSRPRGAATLQYELPAAPAKAE